jgi:Family of unknown function (DUF5681)
MANPNPSPATRFKPGQSGNPAGRPEGTLDRTTISRSLHVNSLAEAEAKPNAFKGTPREFLMAAMVDPDVDYQVRLAAAGALLRGEPPGSAGGKTLEELLREVDARRRGVDPLDEKLAELMEKDGWVRATTIKATNSVSARAQRPVSAPASSSAHKPAAGRDAVIARAKAILPTVKDPSERAEIESLLAQLDAI